jgi:hypothetical protein
MVQVLMTRLTGTKKVDDCPGWSLRAERCELRIGLWSVGR